MYITVHVYTIVEKTQFDAYRMKRSSLSCRSSCTPELQEVFHFNLNNFEIAVTHLFIFIFCNN